MISKFNKAVGYKEPLTMLSWVCSSIGHRGRQINIKTKRTKVTHDVQLSDDDIFPDLFRYRLTET